MRVTRLQKIQALKESIAHWKRMIRWAKKQDPNNLALSHKMLNQIGEAWGSSNCSLCDLFHNVNAECGSCPLRQEDTNGCCNEWFEVEYSNTWGEWLTHASDLLVLMKTKLAELEASLK